MEAFGRDLLALQKEPPKTLGKASITLKELQTLVVKVEVNLNNRPITYVSSVSQAKNP